MSDSLISVIIPVYNVERYLEQCIDSVINQTYSNLEIILVDDGSTDSCPELCERWSRKDKRIHVIHKKNGGLSDARNVGMNASSGDYIGFVDSDDWIAPNMYEILMKEMQASESQVSACGVEMIWDDGRKKLLTCAGNIVLDNTQAMEALINESWLKQPVWYKLYKRSVAVGVPFEVGKSHEDVFWSYQAIARAERVCVVDTVCYYYRQRSDSIMGHKYSLNRLDAVEAKCQRQKFLIEQYPNIQAEGLIDLWFTCLYQGQRALQALPKEEQKKVFHYLEQTLKEFPIAQNDITELKASHRMWLMLENFSVRLACQGRNLAKVGL